MGGAMHRSGRLVGAVLAGGAGSRIGGAKALVELAGRPLVSYPLAAVADAGLEPLVVAKRETPLPALEARVAVDSAEGSHPLYGVSTALAAGGGRPVVAVACDMPFVTADFLTWLAGLDGTAVPMVDGAIQPLLARYAPHVGPDLDAAAHRGSSAASAIAALGPRTIALSELAAFGDPERLLFNVNDARDLERAAALLAAA